MSVDAQLLRAARSLREDLDPEPPAFEAPRRGGPSGRLAPAMLMAVGLVVGSGVYRQATSIEPVVVDAPTSVAAVLVETEPLDTGARVVAASPTAPEELAFLQDLRLARTPGAALVATTAPFDPDEARPTNAL